MLLYPENHGVQRLKKRSKQALLVWLNYSEAEYVDKTTEFSIVSTLWK
jgi:hypothetical protein